MPSLRVDEPVALPFPTAGWKEALPFQFHFSSHVGELVAPDQAGGPPVAEHMCLVLILQGDASALRIILTVQIQTPDCAITTISAKTLKFPSAKVLNFFSLVDSPSHMLILS